MSNKLVQLKDGNDNVFPIKASIIPFTCSPVSGCTIDIQKCWYEPDTKRVVINLFMRSDSLTGNETWCNVPFEYKPSSQQTLNVSSHSGGYYTVLACCARIESNGEVKIGVTPSTVTVASIWGEYYL